MSWDIVHVICIVLCPPFLFYHILSSALFLYLDFLQHKGMPFAVDDFFGLKVHNAFHWAKMSQIWKVEGGSSKGAWEDKEMPVPWYTEVVLPGADRA